MVVVVMADNASGNGGGKRQPSRPSRRSLLKTASVGAAGLTAGCLGGLSGGDSGVNKITIGGLSPLSGPYSISGERQKIAMEMAVDHAIEAGDTTAEVELLMADTESTPSAAQANAQQHLDDGADFIAGNISSAVAMALGELAQRRDVIFMGGAGDLTITSEKCMSNTFILSDGAVQQTNAALGHALRNDMGSSVFEITVDYSWGESIRGYNKETLIPEHNAEYAGNVFTPLGTSDFSQSLTEAKESGADIINITQYGGDQIRALSQADEFGLMDGDTIITVPSTTVAFAQQVGMDTFSYENLYGGVAYSWKLDTPENNSFVSDFKERSGGKIPLSYTPAYYCGLRMMLRTIEETGSTDSATLRGELEGKSIYPQIWNQGERIRECDHRATAPTMTIQGLPPAEADVENGDIFDIVSVPEQLEQYMRPCEETGCTMS